MNDILVTIRVGDKELSRAFSGEVDHTDVEAWGERTVDMLEVLVVSDDQRPLL